VSELEDCCGSVLGSRCYERQVAEARREFGYPEEGERPPLVKTQQDEMT
jgi:hypothetical protein